MAPTPLVLIGVSFDLVALSDAPPATGVIWATPARRTQLTWQTIHAVAPASITWTLEGSNDGTNFETIATTTVVGGAINTVNTSAKFIRVNLTASSGGSGFRVIGVCKA